MSDKPKGSAGAQDWLERPLRWVALAGGAMLFAIMLLVSWAVFARYVLNDPILGDTELVQIGMSIVVMLAIPYAALKGAHIRVDILDRPLGALGRFLGDVFARVLGIYVLFLLVRKALDKAFDAYEYEDVTNMIELPVWIAYAAIVAGMGLFAVVLLYQLVMQFRQGVNGYE